MTRKVFWDDPYRTTLDTHITSVDGDVVTVAETIFYALSGGQESDAGSIGGHVVTQARKDSHEIFYTLPTGHGLAANDAITIEIDWTRRYRLMRLHFAAELVLELTCKALGSVEKIGAHISQDKARIDFDWAENISPLFPQLTAEAQAIIDADTPITSAFSDETNERRYWEVVGLARVPCGGTHLKRTGEVGRLSLKRKNVGRGKERIEIYVSP
ncbi:alanyl-tRNA editing protein [Uliginosibacterium sp. H3]|uniref:Alanyl-tRNA editing protein n=1 Tax=Uliginosibacterium silvisoli TaxID=3114758 RepID=A0ABU6JZM1_9RHOO|nr:alanyl-tRNA editing protein [Uliginosibacterium sp. H3]